MGDRVGDMVGVRVRVGVRIRVGAHLAHAEGILEGRVGTWLGLGVGSSYLHHQVRDMG